MIGFVSRMRGRTTAPLPASGAGPVTGKDAAGKDAAAGRGASSGNNAPTGSGRGASSGNNAPAGRGASSGNNAPAGNGSASRHAPASRHATTENGFARRHAPTENGFASRHAPIENGFASRHAPAGQHAPAGNGAAISNCSAGSGSAGSANEAPGTFIGAALPICGVDVLVVVVHPWVLADIHEANLYVVAFHERFRRTIVLASQGAEGTPCFYGPTELIRVLQGLPFEMIPWRRLLFRTAPQPAWRLPLPPPRGHSGRTNDEHIGADSAAGTLRAASVASATPTVGAHRAGSTDDTTPLRREGRVHRAARTTAH